MPYSTNMDPKESHMGEEPPNKNMKYVNKSILDVFQDLGNNSDMKRNESCILLVKHLAESASNEESTDGTSKELLYCLKRLVRGLGASRSTIQKGYFAALVGILQSFPVPYETLHNAVEQELNCSHKSSKSEEGESLLGQALAWGAAIRSGLFTRSTFQQKQEMLSSILSSGKKKSYLPFVTTAFITHLIKNAEEEEFRNVIWPLLKDEVSKPWPDQTQDTLLHLVTAHLHHPGVVKNKFIQKSLGCQLLELGAMQHFAQLLVSFNSASSLSHPLYEQFCLILTNSKNAALLNQFWLVDVDKQLAASTRSKELSALHILVLLLKNLQNKEQVEQLFTVRILQIVGRILGAPRVNQEHDPELPVRAKQVLTTVGEMFAGENISEKMCLGVLNKLLFISGDLQYEKKTGTHIAILLESKLSIKGVQELAKKFRDVVDGSRQLNGIVWTNRDRKFAAQQLSRLVGHSACHNEIDWKVEQLIYLLRKGLFQDKNSVVGIELANTVKQCFFRALDQKYSSLQTNIQMLSKLVKYLDPLIQGSQLDAALRAPLSKQGLTSWKKMVKVISSLESKSHKTNGVKGSTEHIFHTLFLQMGLQLLADTPMATEALEELHSCYNRMESGRNNSRKSDEPQWVEVAVDLLLSLLSRDSHLLRTVVSSVFPHLCKHLTVTSFCQILEVLDPDQNENPLSNGKELADESDEDSASELSSDESSEGKSIKKKKSHENNGRSSESTDSDECGGDDDSDNDSAGEGEDDDDDDDDDDPFEDSEEETVNDKLRMGVRQALGNAASLTDTESVDLDEIDEEEGHRMDAALAQAFKTLRQSRSNKKSKKQSKSEEAITHFRVRVLDLVELLLSRDPPMALCLEAIAPLLSLLAFCLKDAHQSPLEQRVKNVLRKLTAVKKFSTTDGVDENGVADQLKALGEKGTRTAAVFLGIVDQVSDCCTFLVRCSEYISNHVTEKTKASQSPVTLVCKALLTDFFTKRDFLLPFAMFQSVLQLQWEGCWDLASVVVENAFDRSVRPFRRVQALDLFSVFLRNNRLLSTATQKQKKMLASLESDLSSHAIDLMKNATSADCNPGHRRNRFQAELFRLLVQIISRGDSATIDKPALTSALCAFCETVPSVTSDTRKKLTLLAKHLKCPIGPLKKLKNTKPVSNGNADSEDSDESDNADEENSSDDKEKSAVKKKKKKVHNNKPAVTQLNGFSGSEQGEVQDVKDAHQNVQKAKSRKQKKIQRMAAMAEGLESVTFSIVNDSTLYGMDADEGEEDILLSQKKLKTRQSPLENGASHSEATPKRKQSKSLSEPADMLGTNNYKKKKRIN